MNPTSQKCDEKVTLTQMNVSIIFIFSRSVFIAYCFKCRAVCNKVKSDFTLKLLLGFVLLADLLKVLSVLENLAVRTS